MKRRVATSAFAVVLAGAIGVAVVVSAAILARPAHRGPRADGLEPKQALLVRDVRSKILRGYYRPVPGSLLRAKTVDGLIASLRDPYTRYLTPSEYESLRNRTARAYSGIGLTVGPSRGGLIVTSALEGPARDAGIRRGDVIVRIDGRPAETVPFSRSLALIKGEQGTLVHLTVRRPVEGVIRFTVMRREIAAPSLRSRMIVARRTRVGYVRLLSFPANAADRLADATGALVHQGARALIVDVRGNPGGLLDQAVRSVSLYLDDGVVCTLAGAHQPRRAYAVDGTATYPRLPLVVLVDGGSASAAEILASALGDHHRAVVVGERTYGKTSVQSVFALGNGGALRLTTATYRTPAGDDIVDTGVVPDVIALDDPLTRPDEGVLAGERVLLNALGTQTIPRRK
jgi:carboxyl-terminal processing protease